MTILPEIFNRAIVEALKALFQNVLSIPDKILIAFTRWEVLQKDIESIHVVDFKISICQILDKAIANCWVDFSTDFLFCFLLPPI